MGISKAVYEKPVVSGDLEAASSSSNSHAAAAAGAGRGGGEGNPCAGRPMSGVPVEDDEKEKDNYGDKETEEEEEEENASSAAAAAGAKRKHDSLVKSEKRKSPSVRLFTPEMVISLLEVSLGYCCVYFAPSSG